MGTMVVTQPIKVTTITWVQRTEVTVPDFPSNPALEEHKIVLQSPFYIERDDFRTSSGEKGYRRLCPGQTVGLRYAGLVMEMVDTVMEAGQVVEIKVKLEPVETTAKPKAFIHWVSDPEDSTEVPGGFLDDVAENTLEERRSLADKHLLGSKTHDRYQFERLGFFCVDTDSVPGNLVFNLTVGLKEDAGKA